MCGCGREYVPGESHHCPLISISSSKCSRASEEEAIAFELRRITPKTAENYEEIKP